MTKDISCDLEYRHTFSDASSLLHNICRNHYCLKYEEWKEIFEDILEQVSFDEEYENVRASHCPGFWESLISEKS